MSDDQQWRAVVEHVMEHIGLSATMVETPTQAASLIDVSLDTLRAAVDHANTQVQMVATYSNVVVNQGKILDAFAAVLGLPQGKPYMDMVPMLRELMAKAGMPEMQDVPPEPPPGTLVQ